MIAAVHENQAAAPANGTAVAIENEAGGGTFVIVCDHASNRLPQRWGTLGLDAQALESHIAWDPGAIEVSRTLSRLLDAPLVRSTVSRLVVDCNRPENAADAMPAISETTQIPGNQAITPSDRQARLEYAYKPYHDAINGLLNARHGPTALVAVHTFTPVYKGVPRPWPIGIIFNEDRRLADPLITFLRRTAGLNVGVNEPYSPADRVYHTLERHGEQRGLAPVMIEIRNDEVRTEQAQDLWAERLADGLRLAERIGLQATSSGTA